jgi:type IV pilus assembly protein PilP
MRLFLVCLFPLLLLGCAAEEHQDLRQWMRDEAKGMRGKVPPLPEITAFPVVAYETEEMTPPFAPGKIVTQAAISDKTAPDRTRPQQPLEIFPIEDLRVVGVIMAGTVPYALVQTPPPNKPKHVRVGEYMGRNFGKITDITTDGVTVVETVKDVNGAWVEQERSLLVPKEGGR